MWISKSSHIFFVSKLEQSVDFIFGRNSENIQVTEQLNKKTFRIKNFRFFSFTISIDRFLNPIHTLSINEINYKKNTI